MVFNSINNRAPSYLADLLVRHVTSRSPRSSDLAFLTVPRTRSKHKGDRAFVVIAPNLWNKLPLEIRMAQTLAIFRFKLKYNLLSVAFLKRMIFYKWISLSLCWVIIVYFVKHFGQLGCIFTVLKNK